MKELLMKYKEIIMYLVFGVLTTVVNIVVYFLSAELPIGESEYGSS